MGRKRVYTEQTRRAIHELAEAGLGATEISKRLAAGDAGVPAIEIPRTTVADIARVERQRVAIPEGAILLLKENGPEEMLRLVRKAHAEREAERVARAEARRPPLSHGLRFAIRDERGDTEVVAGGIVLGMLLELEVASTLACQGLAPEAIAERINVPLEEVGRWLPVSDRLRGLIATEAATT